MKYLVVAWLRRLWLELRGLAGSHAPAGGARPDTSTVINAASADPAVSSETDPPEPTPSRTPPSVAVTLSQGLADTLGLSVADVEAQSVEIVAHAGGDWQRVQARLRELKQIPALQSLARKFMVSLDRQVVAIPEVVAAIGHDPALALRVLRMGNSVAVSSREPISDLATAVHMIGVERVRRLASAMLLQRDGEGMAAGFHWRHLWMHSLATAILAERLDEWSGRHAGPSVLVCAILHDVGKIALSVVVPDLYRVILLQSWQQRLPLPVLELAHLGMDHREAGWTFGFEADLPPVVLDTIAHHDDPLRARPEHRATVALVAVANQWAKLYGLGFSGDGAVSTEDLWETAAWKTWAALLPTSPDTRDFALHERGWITEVRRELMEFHA